MKFQPLTLDQAKQIVEAEGFEPLNGACWEDEQQVFASSVKTVPGTYGHPACEVQYMKETGWFTVHPSGRNKSVKLSGGAQ